MSGHYASCPKSGSMALYSDCQCEAISQREHTRALDEQTQALRQSASDHDDLMARIDRLERAVKALLRRTDTRPPADDVEWWI